VHRTRRHVDDCSGDHVEHPTVHDDVDDCSGDHDDDQPSLSVNFEDAADVSLRWPDGQRHALDTCVSIHASPNRFKLKALAFAGLGLLLFGSVLVLRSRSHARS